MIVMRRWLAAGLAAILFVPAAAHAQDVELEIRESGTRKIPLAVAPFRQTTGAPAPEAAETLRRVLLDDLEFSGVFAVQAGEPPASGYDLPAAKSAGIQAVVRGDFTRSGDAIVWEVRLLDAFFDRQVLGKRYRGDTRWARQVAHAFADEVVRAYTGKPGVAQTQLAFLTPVNGHKELFVMDYDGANVRQVTNVRDLVLSPAWAADGLHLYYTSYHAGNPDLYRTTIATGAFERISGYNGLNTTPAVSPDGRELALTLSRDGNAEVYVMNLATKRVRRLTFGTAVDTEPTWAPNGQELAFVSDREGGPQIYVMDRDGADARRITHKLGYTTSPAWSPQGDRIAFVASRGGVFQIMTVTPYGGGLTQLTQGTANCEDPSWSPDGRHIAYTRTSGRGPSEVWVIRADGTGARRVCARPEGCSSPAWSPYR